MKNYASVIRWMLAFVFSVSVMDGCGGSSNGGTEEDDDDDNNDESGDDDDDTDSNTDEDEPACSDPITFANEVLEQAVRDAIWLPDGDINFSDVADLEALTASNLNAGGAEVDISGLECLSNLKRLGLTDSGLDYLYLVGKLWKLEVLSLKYNEIEDIDPLDSLIFLKELDLEENRISELDAIKDLETIEKLNISKNHVISLDALEDLTAMHEFSASTNNIEDISALQNMMGMTFLELSTNVIRDIDAVANLEMLQELRLAQNDIEDIGALAGLAQIEILVLNENQIGDLGPLVDNDGIGDGDDVYVGGNPIDCDSQAANIQALIDRGVNLVSDCN